MSGLLRRLFGRTPDPDGPMDYARARRLARHPDAGVRERLAARTDVKPEILYFLAEDAAPAVRRAIAANESTPPHAYARLARDSDDDVRCDLALRIARLTPGLSDDARDRIRRLTLDALDVLARDQIARVRRVLSETLKDVAGAPPEVIRRLARDSVLEVAAPVLEFSPLLTEDDLVEIIASPAVAGAVAAVSRRAGLTERVSDAVVASADWDAVATLLANPSAQVREETLDRLAEDARTVTRLQMPLALRPKLPARAARRLAGFVADTVLAALMRRADLDPETAGLVEEAVRTRLRTAPEGAGAKGGIAAPPGQGDSARVADEVRHLFEAGALDDARLDDELVSGNRAFVTHALALRAGLPAAVVARIAAARSAKAVTALAWKAGLTMRFAVKLQSRFAGVPPPEMLQAKDGIDYPLGEDDMRWQLDFYGTEG